MIERIKATAFSFNGVSILIGAIGLLSGLVTMFVDVNQQISVKWILFSLLVISLISSVFLKVIYDLSVTVKAPPLYERPIKYVSDENVFVIRRNENFINNIVVGCYINRDEIDKLAYVGVVHIVQSKVIQIRLVTDLGLLDVVPTTPLGLSEIEIRPVIPMTALQHYAGGDVNG